MLLSKSDTSRYSSNTSESRKFKLDCKAPTDDWLSLKRLIKGQHVDDTIILEGILETEKEVVIKIGRMDTLKKEYDIGLALKEYPNFIRYYCNFNCLESKENLDKIIKGQLSRVCSTEGKFDIGVLIMPYYPMGDIESYKWQEEEFGLLKNVLKQICFGLMYAYEKTGFIHNDEHLGNVLLRKTSKKSLNYGDLELPLEGLYVVIMDFEKSTLNYAGDVYDGIKRILNLVCSLGQSDIKLAYPDYKFSKLLSSHTKITKQDYIAINDIIDEITIRYVKSKLPRVKLF